MIFLNETKPSWKDKIMIADQEVFELTEDHIKLLKNANVSWYDQGYLGAPCFDSKCPYRSSNIEKNIAEIIGLELFEDADGEKHLSKIQYDLCVKLHQEMEKALSVVLSTTSFIPGRYTHLPYHRNWYKI